MPGAAPSVCRGPEAQETKRPVELTWGMTGVTWDGGQAGQEALAAELRRWTRRGGVTGGVLGRSFWWRVWRWFGEGGDARRQAGKEAPVWMPLWPLPEPLGCL